MNDPSRHSGLLFHPTALPGTPGSGSFGAAARAWIDLLSQQGVSVWQVLPLAPTDSTGSPYSSPSGSALNPWLIDADDLLAAGLITAQDHQDLPGGCADRLDPPLATARAEALKAALISHWSAQGPDQQGAFRLWRRQQRCWLYSHCLFMVLRRLQGGRPWWEWPAPLAQRHRPALRQLVRAERQALLGEALLQWQLELQWQQLRQRARQRGVRLLGDLPFYVAHDSVDVWQEPDLFSLGAEGQLLSQSGVPPDYFSATGQLWGTPVYRWSRHWLGGFSWWLDRLERQLELFDLLRLDHFRALEAFWNVPGGEQTAQNGSWVAAPGDVLLELLRCRCRRRGWLLADDHLPLIAEDLGVITPAVEALRDQFALPGMKVLQFAFDGSGDNPYLPANFGGSRWVVYTGTHDNATSRGWWDSLDQEARSRVETAMAKPVQSPSWQLLQLALASTAELAVVPIQDLLELGDEARFNTPGTIGGNWSWRLQLPIVELAAVVHAYGAMAAGYGRGAAGGAA